MVRKRLASSLAFAGALVASLLVSVAAAHAESRNLLVNPGFEAPLEGHPWMPSGWDTSATGLQSVYFGRDTLDPHSGSYSISVANVSMLIPLAQNWNQTLLVGREVWDKDVVFSVWTKSAGVEGRSYILLQAYRDTVSKMARIWGIDRDDAGPRLGIQKVDDPLIDLGWKREYFSDAETGWVRREIRVHVPPTTNVLFVRCGLYGTGQVQFDDATLVAEPPQPPAVLPVGKNLLLDPGFEGDGNAWEYSVPPYEGTRVERDTLIAHSGKASIRFSSRAGLVKARTGVCQVICNPNLSGKRLKLSAYVKTDSLRSEAYLKMYCHTMKGVVSLPGPEQASGTHDWGRIGMEMDVPAETYSVWVWFVYNAPAEGIVHFDDVSLEVLGPTSKSSQSEPSVKPKPRKSPTPRKG